MRWASHVIGPLSAIVDVAQAGKGSFKFAWVMDQTEEERTRGVTVDVGTAHFQTPSGRQVRRGCAA